LRDTGCEIEVNNMQGRENDRARAEKGEKNTTTEKEKEVGG